ncbi:MAG: hypothetical protein ACRC0V_05730 [Fusobacteriaceae bacterium]
MKKEKKIFYINFLLRHHGNTLKGINIDYKTLVKVLVRDAPAASKIATKNFGNNWNKILEDGTFNKDYYPIIIDLT